MTEEKKKAPKFEMPGQTKELDMGTVNSASNEANLTFYETLHQQRPKSEMAIRWLLQHGKLPLDEAKLWSKKLGTAKKATAVASSSKTKLKVREAPGVALWRQPASALSAPSSSASVWCSVRCTRRMCRAACHQANDDDFAKKSAAKKAKKAASPDSSEADDSEDEFDDKKKGKAAPKKGAAKPPPKKAAKPPPKPKAKPKVVNDDDSSSDEEGGKPLAKAAAAAGDSSEDEAPLSGRKKK